MTIPKKPEEKKIESQVNAWHAIAAAMRAAIIKEIAAKKKRKGEEDGTI